MSNLFKDMAVLLFSAGDELEKKAGEFKNLREDRYKEFEEKVKNKQEEYCCPYGGITLFSHICFLSSVPDIQSLSPYRFCLLTASSHHFQ